MIIKGFKKEDDDYYMVTSGGEIVWSIKSIGHNLEVIQQYKTLEELNKDFQLCKNYNEY